MSFKIFFCKLGVKAGVILYRFISHGQKKRKRPTKKKQKRTTQDTTPAVTLDNPENLSAYLQTEIGKQHYEFMQSELEKMDFDQLFM